MVLWTITCRQLDGDNSLIFQISLFRKNTRPTGRV